MILLPVIERELRAAARHPFTYNLRVLGVLALLVVFAMFGLEGNIGPGSGGRLFARLHGALFGAIWALVPLLTADAISRERREGTLPLLFLTPLKAHHIVCAKGLVHGLRALTLWLAALPLLTVPLVAGGVGWAEVVISALINFSSICLAMAAGLAASARTRVWTRALIIATGLAFIFLLVFFLSVPAILVTGTGLSSGNFFAAIGYWLPPPLRGPALVLNWDGTWQELVSRFRPSPAPVLESYAAVALLAFLALLLLVVFAAWSVKRSWQEQPPSARVLWLREKLFTPVFFQDALRRWLRWQLNRNPIGWLEQRSWGGRLVAWSWLAIVTCVYVSLFANLSLYQRAFHILQTILASLLTCSIALSAAGSFRRERETGVLELLLVAPLREWQIIGGRVRGLWSQFLPAAALLCAVWLYGATFMATTTGEWPAVLFYSVTFATLPVVGLYFSLAKPNFIVAVLWTLLVQLVIPAVVVQIAALGINLFAASNAVGQPNLAARSLSALCQILFALWLAHSLHDNLKRRKFALDANREV